MKAFPDKKLVLIGHIRDPKYAEEVFTEGGEQVIHIGTLPHGSELHRSAYAACEVFCLPSTLETPGLAALEAAACGAKMVVTEEGATKEYFGDNVLYCSPTSVEDICNKLLDAQTKLKVTINKHFLWREAMNSLLTYYHKNLRINYDN